MRKRSAIRNVAEYCVAVAAVKSLEWLPRAVAYPLARAYTWLLLDLAIPRLRRTALRNLSFAMPELPEEQRRRIADGVFRSIARLIFTFAKFPSIRKETVSQ